MIEIAAFILSALIGYIYGRLHGSKPEPPEPPKQIQIIVKQHDLYRISQN